MNIKEAREICEIIDRNKYELIESDSKYKETYIALNYLNKKGYEVQGPLKGGLMLKYLGIDELVDYGCFNDLDVIADDELEFIEAKTVIGEGLLDVIRYVRYCENLEGPGLIDSDIEKLKDALNSCIDLTDNIDFSDFSYDYEENFFNSIKKNFPEFYDEIKKHMKE